MSETMGMRIDITNKYGTGFTGVVISQTATIVCKMHVSPQNNMDLRDFAV